MRERNWQTVRLGDVADVQSGGTPQVTVSQYWGGNIPWYSSGELNTTFTNESNKYITKSGLENSNAKLFPKGSLLIGMYDTAALKMSILDRNAAFNQAICGIKPSKHIDLLFVLQAITLNRDYILCQRRGVRQKNLNLTKIKDIQIPLPPLPEQQRIVAILNVAFEGIAKAKANAEQNLKNARELFESHLQAVFSQRGEGWISKKLSDICDKITDGTHQTPTYFEKGHIFLSSRNVTSGKINWDHVKFIDDTQHQAMQKRISPKIGDILLAKNGTTGIAAIVDRNVNFDFYVSLALLRSKDIINPKLLLYFVNSPAAKLQFNKRLKGVGVQNLHLKEIREVIIFFPRSEDAQLKLIENFDALQAETQRLESIYQRKIAALDELKNSLLHKAFSGEL